MAKKKILSEKKKKEVKKAMFANLEADGKLFPKNKVTGVRSKKVKKK